MVSLLFMCKLTQFSFFSSHDHWSIFFNTDLRSTSGATGIHAFRTSFLRILFGTSPPQWVKACSESCLKIFDQNALMFPFDASGHKSLFVVIGANHIREYSKRAFKGNRPCIIHFDPNISYIGRHNHHEIADKLRTWLNKMWRWEHTESDRLVTPFNKRTLPVIQSNGKAWPILYIYLHLISSYVFLDSFSCNGYCRHGHIPSEVCIWYC